MGCDRASEGTAKDDWPHHAAVPFRRRFWIFLQIVALLGLPAVAEPLRIGGVEYLGDLPTFVAERDGHFARYHAEVEIVSGVAGRDNLRKLRAGEVDFALMAMTPLVFDALANPARGGPDAPMILANLSHARPVIQLMLLDAGDAPLADALRGRIVGVPRGSNAEYVLHVIAGIAGLSDDDFTLLDMDPVDMGDALAAGRIDAVSVWEPWVGQLRNRFGDRLREEPDTGRYVSRWLLVARRETIENDPGHTLAVLQAYRDAVDWIQANPEPALAAHEARMSGKGWLSESEDFDLVFDMTLDWSLIASYRQQMAWARTTRDMTAKDVPSFMDIVAPAPLAAIAPQAVTIPHVPQDGVAYGK